VYVFELDLEVLLSAIDQHQRLHSGFKPYSMFPAVDRDLAFFVETCVTVAALERLMRKTAHRSHGSLLASVELFDEYRGEHVPAGQRSLAFRLVYRASDRTLTDEEVNPIHQDIREALVAQFSVNLRS
jgi:phenylalanyl-tRNA synthetase beta chain